jgi:6-phosphofructokinase 2
LAGGIVGTLLDGLLDRSEISCSRIAIAGDTRISFTVFERQTGLEYRFVGGGPLIRDTELEACVNRITASQFRYFVSSGSLPRGVPADFLVRVASIVERKGGRFVVDCSGAALKTTLERASVFLVKPSLEELEEFVGHSLDEKAVRDVAYDLVKKKSAQIVAVTMGPAGVVVATQSGIFRQAAVKVDVRSSVGAGDSFLSAMVLAISRGKSIEEAARFGVAAGGAALLRPGTKLCERNAFLRLLEASRSESLTALD